MRSTFFVLAPFLMSLFCYAQQLTKDGFGTVHWGASVAEADQAFPDSKKKGPSNGGGWMMEDGIPCDLILQPKANYLISLIFYDGKFLALKRRYLSKSVPVGAITDSFRNDLRQTILNELGNNEKIDITVSVGRGSPERSMAPFLVDIKMFHKELVQSAMEHLQTRLDKFRNDLLRDVPNEVLKP